MTREEWMAGVHEHFGSQGMNVTDDMLKTANLVYYVVERWKGEAFSEEEAFSELFAWLNEPKDDLHQTEFRSAAPPTKNESWLTRPRRPASGYRPGFGRSCSARRG